MSEIILSSSPVKLPVPLPKEQISIRPGTMDDILFIDQLQKKYSKNLAFLPTKALEGKIKAGHVLVAESLKFGVGSLENNTILQTPNHKLQTIPLGYLIGQDQYFKRDDVGIIYHLAVDESKQRGFIGASLLKAQFERSSYGCKLYCCWCAQDIPGNYFYESMGFVPLAFRAGSEKKQRTHIFWEKRIKEGDTTTQWWFPSETKGGMMAEDRLAFPIPPGKHWSDPMPMIFPKDTVNARQDDHRQVGESASRKEDLPRLADSTTRRAKKKPVEKEPGRYRPSCPQFVVKTEAVKIEKPKKLKQPKVKNDPKYVAAARELKDRWLERVNQNPMCLESAGKYNLTKAIEGPQVQTPLMLEAA